MKGMILGLAAGFVAGAVLAKTCKPCGQMIDEMTSGMKSKFKSGSCGQNKQSQQPSEQCECGSDCNCTDTQNCSCGETEQNG